MVLKYYFDSISQPSRAVYIFLKINKFPFEECPISLFKGEHLTEEFAKVNPYKKVPVLSDGDFKLTESNAMFKYLMNTHNLPDHWYPKDPVKQARVEEFLHWYHLGLRLNGVTYFVTKVIVPRRTGIAADAEKVEKAKKDLDQTITQFENYFIKDTPFISSDEISIADIQAICEFEQPIAGGYDALTGHSKFSQWRDRVKEKLQPYFDESHQFVYETAKKYL